MENEKNPQTQSGNDWINEMLASPNVGGEIGPDEQAVSSAGLIHHEDAELERIIHETKAMDASHMDEDFVDEMDAVAEEFADLPVDPSEFSDEEEAALLEEFSDEPLLESPTEIFAAIDMSQAYSDESPEDEIPQERPEPPVRKRRPRMKKGYGLLGIPHVLATAIWLAIAVVIGVSLGRTLWVCAADVLAFGREEKIVTVSVTTEDTMETIAEKLQKAGLVKYPELFLLYADLTDADEKITTGSFTLNTV